MSNSRKLTMEDLIQKHLEPITINKDCISIPKNQKDFGHKKRIKP